MKVALLDGVVVNVQPEYDDVVRAAAGRSTARSVRCWPRRAAARALTQLMGAPDGSAPPWR